MRNTDLEEISTVDLEMKKKKNSKALNHSLLQSSQNCI